MNDNNYIRVNLSGRVYGITASSKHGFGVCKNGVGVIKYMPVVFSSKSPGGYLPRLLKTRLSWMGSAHEIVENIAVCEKLKTFLPECVIVCEHVLQHGHGIR